MPHRPKPWATPRRPAWSPPAVRHAGADLGPPSLACAGSGTTCVICPRPWVRSSATCAVLPGHAPAPRELRRPSPPCVTTARERTSSPPAVRRTRKKRLCSPGGAPAVNEAARFSRRPLTGAPGHVASLGPGPAPGGPGWSLPALRRTRPSWVISAGFAPRWRESARRLSRHRARPEEAASSLAEARQPEKSSVVALRGAPGRPRMDQRRFPPGISAPGPPARPTAPPTPAEARTPTPKATPPASPSSSRRAPGSAPAR